MFTRQKSNRRAAFTLVEAMVAGGILSLALAGVGSFFLNCLRSGAALSNYAMLDEANRHAMDSLTQEIRQAKEISSFTTNPPSITILDGDGQSVTYMFVPETRQMVRTTSGGTRQVLLNDCNLLQFSLYQRNPSNSTFGVFPVAPDNWRQTAKMIQLTWKTSITNSPYPTINSENVQTARIVIRKQTDD